MKRYGWRGPRAALVFAAAAAMLAACTSAANNPSPGGGSSLPKTLVGKHSKKELRAERAAKSRSA